MVAPHRGNSGLPICSKDILLMDGVKGLRGIIARIVAKPKMSVLFFCVTVDIFVLLFCVTVGSVSGLSLKRNDAPVIGKE